MKVVLAAVGTRGDVQPLSVLGAALARRGHTVVVAATPDARPVVDEHGLPFVPCGRDITEWLAGKVVSEIGIVELVREFRTFVATDVAAQLPVLLEASTGADLIVSGGLQILATSAAEKHGCASTYAYYGPQLLPSVEHPPLTVPFQRLPGFMNSWGHELTYQLLRRVMLPAVNGARAQQGLGPLARLVDTLPQDLLIAWDEELSPRPADRHAMWERWSYHPRLHEVGSLQPPAQPLDDDTARFLDDATARPAVYVGFGSMPDQRPEVTHAIVADACARADVRGVMLGGAWADRVQPLDGVRVLRHASHGSLFPRVRAVVHHGGAGTTATAARSGVPQVVVPHFVDQPFWANRMERLGVAAPSLPRSKLTARALAERLRVCLDDGALQERARAMASQLARVDPVARAVDVVERLARSR